MSDLIQDQDFVPKQFCSLPDDTCVLGIACHFLDFIFNRGLSSDKSHDTEVDLGFYLSQNLCKMPVRDCVQNS